MTQNIITVEEIQPGDKIAVTTETSGDRTVTYTGVAHKKDGIYNSNNVWRTKSELNLYAHEDGAVIELLDRPIPTVEVPTKNKAIVKYDVRSFDAMNTERIAHRTSSGKWLAYRADGERMDTHYDDEAFGRFLAAGKHTHEVIFAGVAE